MSQCPVAPLERQDTVLGIWGVPGGTRSGVFKFFLILALSGLYVLGLINLTMTSCH